MDFVHLTHTTLLCAFQCFAWSPDPAFPDLMAVGLSTGKVDLLRLEATRYAKKNVLSTGPVVSLPLRNARQCNALAFAPLDPNYLAVGLDKVRNDHSLVIWDISSEKSALTISSGHPSSAELDQQLSPPSPEIRLPVAQAQTSMKIPRGELPPRADPRIVQQYATTDVVSSLAFVPNTTLVLAVNPGNTRRDFPSDKRRSPRELQGVCMGVSCTA